MQNAQPMGVVTARLVDGPRDGFEDRLILVPELVTVEHCARCRRVHLTEAFLEALPANTPVYLRDHDDLRSGAGLVIYRWLDPDPDLHERLALNVPFGDPVTAAAIALAQRDWDQRLSRLHDTL